MVHRQDAHGGILLICGPDGIHAVDHVGRQVGVRQDDALVRTGGAAGEEDLRGRVEVEFFHAVRALRADFAAAGKQVVIEQRTIHLAVDGDEGLQPRAVGLDAEQHGELVGAAQDGVRIAFGEQRGEQRGRGVDVHGRDDADAAGDADVGDDVADAVLGHDGDVLAAETGVQQAVAEAHHFLVELFGIPVFDFFLLIEFREDGLFGELVFEAAQHVADALVVAVAQQALGLMLAFGQV